MIDASNVRLGKLGYKHDDLTISLARFLRVVDIHIPDKFNFDKGRAPFPDHMWGNDDYGDCVIAARGNAQIRIERVEQRRTLAMVDQDAITQYQKMTGCRSPGDENDTGLVMLDAMRQWRNEGWTMTKYPHHTYTISAYGEIDPMNEQEIRQAIYLLGGVHLGLALPYAAQGMLRNKLWDYSGQSSPDYRPNSWGGHAVYAYAYDQESITIKTWAMDVKVTNEFMNKYCDECWAVVDQLDSWKTKQTIDVAKLQQELHKITNRVNQ